MDISRPHHTRPPFKAFVHAVVLLAMPLSSFTAVCAKLSVRMSSLRRADLHSSVDLPGHQHPHPPGTWDVQHPYSTGLLSHLHPMSAQQPHVPLLLSVDSTRYSQRRPARTSSRVVRGILRIKALDITGFYMKCISSFRITDKL
ncbi:hypothetical protein Smp_120390 [Schistosoma mansoni]|uniref:hypothetical protein n=1 Tax=Schistosoma mansoni TaxID=6183 RepID=UPI00022C8459|nr:hypothetical protein Smp_120390 [Schistosoma mansoni]|eukprot:XP_018644628.1 hypothetical protein Smp_120390 [Schistosoma mansoni]